MWRKLLSTPHDVPALVILTKFFGMHLLVLGLFGRVFAAGAST